MSRDSRTWSLGAADAVTDTLSPSDGFAGIVALQITGTWVGTITFQATIDGTNWVSVLAVPSDSTTAATTTTGNGIFRVDAGGYFGIRAKVTAYTSGTAVVRANNVIG